MLYTDRVHERSGHLDPRANGDFRLIPVAPERKRPSFLRRLRYTVRRISRAMCCRGAEVIPQAADAGQSQNAAIDSVQHTQLGIVDLPTNARPNLLHGHMVWNGHIATAGRQSRQLGMSPYIITPEHICLSSTLGVAYISRMRSLVSSIDISYERTWLRCTVTMNTRNKQQTPPPRVIIGCDIPYIRPSITSLESTTVTPDSSISCKEPTRLRLSFDSSSPLPEETKDLVGFDMTGKSIVLYPAESYTTPLNSHNNLEYCTGSVDSDSSSSEYSRCSTPVAKRRLSFGQSVLGPDGPEPDDLIGFDMMGNAITLPSGTFSRSSSSSSCTSLDSGTSMESDAAKYEPVNVYAMRLYELALAEEDNAEGHRHHIMSWIEDVNQNCGIYEDDYKHGPIELATICCQHKPTPSTPSPGSWYTATDGSKYTPASTPSAYMTATDATPSTTRSPLKRKQPPRRTLVFQ